MFPRSNEESWQFIVENNREYPETEYWKKWRSIVDPVIDQSIAAGYNRCIRAGKSMHDLLFSTLDHHRIHHEAYVRLRVVDNQQLEIQFIPANYAPAISGPHKESKVVEPYAAFPVFTRFLQHLWTETVPEPIPECLRDKGSGS
jgi:hypothetical protein